jgi:Tat protein secretion system quality control protein TatD with DNase activity
MEFVDAHIHLSDPEYNEKIPFVMNEAKQSGIAAMVSNSMDFETSLRSLKLAQDYPEQVYAALGIHPWSVGKLGKNEVEQTINLISNRGQNNQRIIAGGAHLES